MCCDGRRYIVVYGAESTRDVNVKCRILTFLSFCGEDAGVTPLGLALFWERTTMMLELKPVVTVSMRP